MNIVVLYAILNLATFMSSVIWVMQNRPRAMDKIMRRYNELNTSLKRIGFVIALMIFCGVAYIPILILISFHLNDK